jgi:hypothetical protein
MAFEPRYCLIPKIIRQLRTMGIQKWAPNVRQPVDATESQS